MVDQTSLPQHAGSTYLQAKASNEVIKVKKAKIQLQQLKDQCIEKVSAIEHVKKLQILQRQYWQASLPVISEQLADVLDADKDAVHQLITQGVEEQLAQLGERRLIFP